MTTSGEKKLKKSAGSKKNLPSLAERLHDATKDVVYISEIDEPFTIFEYDGDRNIVAEIEKQDEVESIDFAKFFDRLTQKRDWHGEREIARRKKFLDLQMLIEESLTELKVYRMGRTRIRILIIGRAENGHYIALETNAVET